MLLADLKRAGCSEAQIKEALAEQCSRLLSQADPETEASGYLARPEFTQLLLQIDAARDADGVPTDPDLVSAFILRYSETLLDHPFSPLLVVAMDAIIPRSRQAGHDCRCARPTFCADPSVLRGADESERARAQPIEPGDSGSNTDTERHDDGDRRSAVGLRTTVASRLLDSKNSLHCSQPCLVQLSAARWHLQRFSDPTFVPALPTDALQTQPRPRTLWMLWPPQSSAGEGAPSMRSLAAAPAKPDSPNRPPYRRRPCRQPVPPNLSTPDLDESATHQLIDQQHRSQRGRDPLTPRRRDAREARPQRVQNLVDC